VTNYFTLTGTAYGNINDVATGMGASSGNWYGFAELSLSGQTVSYDTANIDRNGWGTASDGIAFRVLRDGTILVAVRNTALSLSGNTANVVWDGAKSTVNVEPNIVKNIADLSKVKNVGLIQVQLDDAGGARVAIYRGTVNEKTSLEISSNYSKEGNVNERGKSLQGFVDQFGSGANLAINGGFFNARDGLVILPGTGDIVGICYAGKKKGTGVSSNKAAIIWDGTGYRISTLDSEIKYNTTIGILGNGGWILSGGDPYALVDSGNVQSGWTNNLGKDERSMIGYSSDNAPIIAATVSGRLTYQQSADIMKNIGCQGAIMLDGGNSTAIYANNRVLHDTGTPVPFLGQRMIPNAIFITNK